MRRWPTHCVVLRRIGATARSWPTSHGIEKVVTCSLWYLHNGTRRAAMETAAQRVALITGASQGLGQALATELAEQGWTLIIDARRADRLRAAAADLASRTNVVAIAGDIADASHRAALVDAVHDAGRLDLLVNNASTLGGSPLPALDAIDLKVFRNIYEVNVVAPLALTQALLPALVAAHGTIVNVTSDAAVEAYEGWGGYGSSKAAFEQGSAVLAAEHPDVRVLTVDPGDMRTEMHQDAFPGEDISDRPLPATVAPGLVALIESDHPSGRKRVSEVVS